MNDIFFENISNKQILVLLVKVDQIRPKIKFVSFEILFYSHDFGIYSVVYCSPAWTEVQIRGRLLV